jgi:uridine kinase
MPIGRNDLGDVAAEALSRSPLLARLDDRERAVLYERMDLQRVPARTRVHGDADAGRHLYIVLEGLATWRRVHLPVRHLGPGDHFGELSATGERHLGEVVTSETPLTTARLDLADLAWLEREAPRVALRLALALSDLLGREVARLSGDAGALLHGRSLPRASSVQVAVLGQVREVPTGTRLEDLLPERHEGSLVVAALLGARPVSLETPIFTDGAVAPLTLAHWEGRQVYAQSVGLLLLEAALDAAPGLSLRMGPSRGPVQVVQLDGHLPAPPAELATRLAEGMAAHAVSDAPFRQEHWATDEARAWFEQRGWADAVRLLRLRRQGTVRLASCGRCYAVSMGPLLPSTGRISGFTVEPHPEGLALGLGPGDPRTRVRSRAAPPVPPARDGDMVTEHQRWLSAMGVDSVGALAELCIDGRVSQLIRVSEGFHEKRISRVADQIAAARDRIRVITIAGPSSSGKTTFIKRLTVQLQIDGVNPVALSLDDYYVDRERTPRDQNGEWNFEALEALDLERLQDDVRRLLAGEAVRPPRYDFQAGRSLAHGGRELRLGRGDALLLEGIHGLNPRLLGDIPAAGQLFRIFVHPATTLPFDRLSRVSATDLRLLRRIVRDRHQRGYKAAENIARWPSVQAGEREHIFPFQDEADAVFDSALVYEPAVLKIFAERYLLEVPGDHPAFPTAHRLRYLVDNFVSIHPEHVPPTSILREFIGGSGFEY